MSAQVGLLEQQKGSRFSGKLVLILPFVFSAALHLSVVFKMFAALPIVYAYLRMGRVAGIGAIITNIAIVWALMGRLDAAWFFIMSAVLGSAIAESVKAKLRIELVVLVPMAMMILASSVIVAGYAKRQNLGTLEMVKSVVSSEVDEFVRNAEKYKQTATMSSQDLEKILVDPEMAKQNILHAIPSFGIIALLILVVSNVLLMTRMNLQNVLGQLGLSPDYFKRWRTPDHMVWLALAAGFCLVVEIPGVSEIALGVFRVLGAIYCIQGLAILSALFDTWGMRGAFRPLVYIVAVTFLLPLVISLGFFDLWFLFREKFGGNEK